MVCANDGKPFHVDEEGRFWRTFVFVDGVCSYDAVEQPKQAEQAGHALA